MSAELTTAERELLWTALRRIRHEDAPVSILKTSDRTHALWAIAPAVEQILADRAHTH